MKQILFFLFLLFISVSAFGQCSLSLGNDTSVCVFWNTETFPLGIGESVSIENGNPPFTYSWSLNYSMGPIEFHASQFLNDTTLVNPELYQWTEDSLAFELTVTDATGQTCSDTKVVYFCTAMITLQDKFVHINQGDTTELYTSTWLTCEPIEYHWSPEYNISDPNSATPQVWPDTTTYYVCTVTNAQGCEILDETFEVYVTPLSTEKVIAQADVRIFPNPMSESAFIEIRGITPEDLRLEFYDASGKIAHHSRLISDRLEINRSQLQPGMYLYRLYQGNLPIADGKFVVQ